MLLEPPKFLPGFGYGERLPAVRLALSCPAMAPSRRQELSDSFLAMLDDGEAGPPAPFDAACFADTVEGGTLWFLGLVSHVQAIAGLPELSAPRVISHSADADLCIVPALHHALRPLAGLLSAHVDLPDDDPRRAAMAQAAKASLAALRIGPYRAHLLEAAFRAGIAIQQISNLVFQFGIGRHSVQMDSTITEHTSSIGARLARSKTLTAAALRSMGLPVPEQRLASSEDDAVRIAARLSYPVVVKPADLDGGAGVAPDLRSEAEVREAFAAARKLSSRILVEEFVPGHDYRLMVFRGRLIWACIKEPAGVTGDGRLSVAQLVEQANLDPERGDGVNTPLKLLALDAEADALLARDGLIADAIPEAGRFVRLRRASNVAVGGRAIDVTDKVHPDNARLAAAAADVLRLDLAGVDVLLPDISCSWLETGGAICEVNAQPQVGGQDPLSVYRLILDGLLGGSGKVPVIATLGGNTAEATARWIEAHFKDQGLTVGRHGQDGTFLNGERLLAGGAPLMRGARLLSSRRELDALIFAIGDDSPLGTGLPLPHVDTLVLSGDIPELTGGNTRDEHETTLGRLFTMIAPACGRILLARPPVECAPGLCAALDAAGCRYELADEEKITAVLEKSVADREPA